MLDKYSAEIREISNFVTKSQEKTLQLEVLDLLFTKEELSQLEDRYAIIKALFLKRETQRELASRLKLSIAKITRGSHALKRISPELRAYIGEFFHE